MYTEEGLRLLLLVLTIRFNPIHAAFLTVTQLGSPSNYEQYGVLIT